MDNICHTLVGAGLGEAGLKRRTALGNATLMIAANLPDIDVAVLATSASTVEFRRGWTHGVLAQALLPPLLALLMYAAGRRRGARPAGDPAPHLGWLVGLSYLGVFSHVGLDWLNNYGVRLLMPLSPRWFYGDTLFIIDPWLWAVLGLGVWMSRRQGTPRAARRALALAFVYVLLMVAGARAARTVVLTAWEATHEETPVALMVGPRPVTPLTRDIILDAGDRYVTGTFTWVPLDVQWNADAVSKNSDAPEVATARRNPAIASFLVWSRFPAWNVAPSSDGTEVTVSDMRFSALRRVVGGARFEAGVTIPR